MQLVIDVDDLSPSKPGLELLMRLKQHYPALKVTCFTPAMDQAVAQKKMPEDKLLEWAKIVSSLDWIEIAPHGFLHFEHEMELTYKQTRDVIVACEEVFKKIGLPFVKIWKSPHWQTSKEAYQALRDAGYVVAVDKNQPIPQIPGLKMYVYDKSLEQPLTKEDMEQEVIKWHGHIGGTFYNDISWCVDAVTTAPTDAEFLTISEYIEKYGTTKWEAI